MTEPASEATGDEMITAEEAIQELTYRLAFALDQIRLVGKSQGGYFKMAQACELAIATIRANARLTAELAALERRCDAQVREQVRLLKLLDESYRESNAATAERDRLTAELAEAKKWCDKGEAACKAATAKIRTLKAERDAARAELAAAKHVVKLAKETNTVWQKECDSLRQQLAERDKEIERLIEEAKVFTSYALTCQIHNTPEWMRMAVHKFNQVCEAIGEKDRFKFDGFGFCHDYAKPASEPERRGVDSYLGGMERQDDANAGS